MSSSYLDGITVLCPVPEKEGLHTEAQGRNSGIWSQIRQLVGVKADAFLATFVAIRGSNIRMPKLVFWLMPCPLQREPVPFGHFFVHDFLDIFARGFHDLWEYLRRVGLAAVVPL